MLIGGIELKKLIIFLFVLINLAFVSIATSEVLINEFLAQGSAKDWVEIYYTGSSSANLTSFAINDSTSQMAALNLILNSTNRFAYFNVSTRLDNSGDSIKLINSSGGIVDIYTYTHSAPNISEGRYPDGSSVWGTFKTLTPREANMDDIPPSVVLVSPSTEGWHNLGSIIINATATDNVLVNNIHAVLKGQSGNKYSNLMSNPSGNAWNATFHLSSIPDGNYTLKINATDSAGNENSSVSQTGIMIDHTAPVTTDNSPSGWQNSDFTVTLTAVDGLPLSSSGVAYMTYRIGSNAPQNGTTIPITTNGNHSITYYSVDNVGNAEVEKIVYAALDKNPPIVKINSPLSGSKIGVALTLNATITDLHSGLQSVIFILTNGSETLQFAPLKSVNDYSYAIDASGLQDGQHQFTIISADFAGNSNNSESVSFLTGNIAPSFYSFSKTPVLSYNNDSVTLSTIINDTFSSISSVTLSGNWTGSWQNYSITISTQEHSYPINSSNFENQQQVGYIWYAKDALGNSVNSLLQSFKVENRAPVLDTIGDKSAYEDSILSFNIMGSDGDGDALTYSSNYPANSGVVQITKINNTVAAVSITPTNDDVGEKIINFTVSDGISNSWQIAIITVINVNDAPFIISSYPAAINPKIGDITGFQDFSISAGDVDVGDNLTTSWYLNGSSVALGNSYNAIGLDIGTYNLTAAISDGTTLASKEWILIVTDRPISSNYSGTILGFSVSELANATGVTINSSSGGIDFGNNTIDLRDVVDLDRYVLISSGAIGIDSANLPALNKPAKITLTGLVYSDTPTILYNPEFGISGNAVCPTAICSNINYNASLGILTFDIAHFSTFWLKGPNRLPVITSSPITTATVGRAYSYDADATDADLDNLTYSLAASPGGMAINAATGQISWTPTATGNYNISLSVSDKTNSTEQKFTLTVRDSPKLDIAKLDIKIDGKASKGIQNGETIGKDAKPGSTIEMKIKVENTYDSDVSDLQIEDITVKVTIFDMDDGSDIDDESDEFNLDAEDDKTLTFTFDVPMTVDEGDYDILIEAAGKDENGTSHKVEWNLKLNVDKKNHEILVDSLRISPNPAKCDNAANLDVSIINTGTEEEEEAALEISSSSLGLNAREDNINLDEGADGNYYNKQFSVPLPENIAEGIYQITIKSFYDLTRETDSKTIDLVVEKCDAPKKQAEEKKETVLVNIIKETPQITTKKQPAPATKISLTKSDTYILVLIGLMLVGTIAVMTMLGLLIKMMRK